MIWYGAWLKWMHMPFLMSAVVAISLKFWQRYGIPLRRHTLKAVAHFYRVVVACHEEHSGGTLRCLKLRDQHVGKPFLAFSVEVVAGLVE